MFKKNINFLKNTKIAFILASAVVIVAALATLIFGLKIDIEFKGGSIATYSFDGEISTKDIESEVKSSIRYSSSVRISENNISGKKNAVISIADEISNEEQIKMTEALEKKFKAQKLALVESSSVNPMNGQSFFIKCLIAVAIAAVLMVIYIAIRFRKIGGWSAGVTAVVALIFDLLVTYSTYAIFGIEIGGNFMAVMLTILGYSINDTIVVFDRVRENNQIYGKKMSLRDNVNLSLNQTFSRTVNTTLTTLIALTVVVVVSLVYNITSMFDFIFPMAVGLVSGVFSSLFLSPNLWVFWKENTKAKR